jgi:arylsulfatase A-like enzyme
MPGCDGSSPPADPATRGPSIVVVSIDTLAAGHMSLYGYARPTTPNLQRLAEGAVVFEHCLANAPWTTPSYLSQLTGLYPLSLRLSSDEEVDMEALWKSWRLSEEHVTLAELLAAEGYRTAAFVDNPMIGPAFGLGQGFERYDVEAFALGQDDPGGGLQHIVPRALRWLDELDGDEPFFLFVQANDVHGPYLPGDRWAGSFAGDGLYDPDHSAPIAEKRHLYGAIPAYIAEPLVGGEAPVEALPTAPIVAAYDEEILAIDDQLGAFFEQLEQRGLLDGSVLVVSADHGESMLEHGWFFGHNTSYEEVLHVPLLIRLPDGAHGGRRISHGVQLVDLFPTLAELAGAGPAAAGLELHGRSLVPLMRGASAPSVGQLSSEGWFAGTTLTVDGWKLIETQPAVAHGHHVLLSSPRAQRWLAARFPEQAGRLSPALTYRHFARLLSEESEIYQELLAALQGTVYELYDLANDPGELRDLSDEQPERLAELQLRLQQERERALSSRQAAASATPVQPTDELLQAMRQLGYAGDG